jgi:4-amino-4-deoxy-L-arabinose transferase-like glycosyltransferase
MNGARTHRASWEWALAVLALLVAFWFRTYRLAEVPPGLHHDDIKNVILVQRIMDGYIRIFYPENNGDEPLYHWMQAIYCGIVGSGYPEVRLLSVGTTMVGVATAYALARRLLGGRVALWTLGWQAVSLWSFFYARRAVRPVLLLPVAAITGYLFVACLDDKPKPRILRGWAGWTLAGVSLGASLYIYQPGRVVPFFFLALIVYLAVLDRGRLQWRWRGVALFFLVGAALFAPLGVYLSSHTEDRVAQVDQPLVALREGDPRPMLENAVRAFGMFTFIGDPHWRQFVADTPVFEPLGAVLFYAGVVLSLRRLRRFEYAFSLLWVPVMLSPAIITEGAPNFLRPIAVLGTVYLFPALASAELLAWLRGRPWAGRRWAWAVGGMLVMLLGYNAWRSYEGYFVRWAVHPDVRFAYNATIIEEGLYLNDATGLDSVVLSGHFPADLDPALVQSALRRRNLVPRWCDVRQSLIYPGGTSAQVFEPDYFPIDPILYGQFMGQPEPAYERRLGDGTLVFRTYPLREDLLNERLAQAATQPVGWSEATQFPRGMPGDLAELAWPVSFSGRADMLGYEILGGGRARPGQLVTLVTYWRAQQASSAQAITFVHVLDPQGQVLVGDDAFGAPPNRWQAGDVIVQLHRVVLPADLASGVYPIEIGWYERDSGQRWGVSLDGKAVVNRLLIGPLQVASP